MKNIWASLVGGAGKAVGFAIGTWKIILAVLIVLPTIFLLGECDGRKVGREQMQHAIDVANTKALAQQQRADALAANQRLTDTLAVSHQEEILRNAIRSTPDTAPDPVRISLGCQRLRNALGGNTANLPAVCRPGGGVQAGASR